MMQNTLSFLMALSPLVLASTTQSSVVTSAPLQTSPLPATSPLPDSSTSSICDTRCLSYLNSCSMPYGGCFTSCSGDTWPTFIPPPCPTTTTISMTTSTPTPPPSTSSCTSSICADLVNTCGQWYGGCYPACSGFTTPSFTDPGCPTTTTSSTLVTNTASCTYVCQDYVDKCGNIYGPCYTSCAGKAVTLPPYAVPSCSLTTAITPTATSLEARGVPI